MPLQKPERQTGQANGAWRHGLRTKESIDAQPQLNNLVRYAKAGLRQLPGSG